MKLNNIFILAALCASTILLNACSGSGGTSASTSAVSNPSYTLTIPSRSSSIYNNYDKGPSYDAVQINNTSNTNLTIGAFSIGTGPVSIVDHTDTRVYNGVTACTSGLTLTSGESCYIFLKANKNYSNLFESSGDFKQTLTIPTSMTTNKVDITSHGYLYIGGLFNQIGNLTAGTIDSATPLVKCSFSNTTDNLSCSNALPNTPVTETTDGSIYTISTDNAGNIYFGGNFHNIIGTSLSSPSNHALLVKFNPATNQLSNAFINTSESPYNSVNPVTSAVTAINFDSNNNAYISGIFDQAGTATAPAGVGQYLLAKCDLSKSSGACSNALQNPTTPFVGINWVSAISFYTESGTSYLLASGNINQISNYSPGPDSIVANCTVSANGDIGGCNNSVIGNSAFNNPDSIAWANLVDNNTAYFGGEFTQIASASAGGNPFLAQCSTNGSGCSNALSSAYINGGHGGGSTRIQTLASNNNGKLFIAGQFNSITNGGTTYAQSLSSNSNLIALCTPNNPNSCINLFSGSNFDGSNKDIESIATNAEITDMSVQVSN